MAANNLQESDHKVAAVAASYCCKASTEHKLVLSGNDRKKTLPRELGGLEIHSINGDYESSYCAKHN